jgi:hypothetical protein
MITRIHESILNSDYDLDLSKVESLSLSERGDVTIHLKGGTFLAASKQCAERLTKEFDEYRERCKWWAYYNSVMFRLMFQEKPPPFIDGAGI